MIRKFTGMAMLLASATLVFAQDETATEPLEISGSVDTYYKYDFANNGSTNVLTSFDNEQNSISLGMIDLALKKKVGKAAFVGEVSFGPRGQYQSLLNGNGDEANADNSFNIQNLYVSLDLSDKFTMTAGYMATFVGYEVISPVGNYNYSTSYLFTNGPFQNAGIKGTYSFSDKASLMVGLFNDWNVYQDFNGVSDFGAQLFVSPADGWSAYLNVLTGSPSGTILDLTTSYQVTDAFKIGLNAADYSRNDDAGGFSGGALYLQNSFTDGFGLGLRGEYFAAKDESDILNVPAGESVFALTLSSNIKAGPLTIIPEVRFDNGSSNMFYEGAPSVAGFDTKSASQFSIAAVYAF